MIEKKHKDHLLDIISVSQFNPTFINKLFRLTDYIQQNKRQVIKDKPLEGFVLANLFFEASTRSRMSFSSAFYFLGGNVNNTTGVTFSSISKGETLQDTIKVIGSYCDILVIRHPELGSAEIAASVTDVPVINAGDGPGEHPTQALLDLYTIFKETGRTTDLHITFVGDLKYGRTVHSLAKLLALYSGITFSFVAPDIIQLPDKLVLQLKNQKHTVYQGDNFIEGIKNADVIYSTRIQRERFNSPDDYAEFDGAYVMSKEIVEKHCKKNVAILHPLPRTNEIDINLDSLTNAAYFRQAENGLYIRMALFLILLNKWSDI